MANFDETILRRRAIDPAAPFPPLHQALRIALYEEYAAKGFHARVVEAYGPRPPFPLLGQAAERRIAALSGLCERFGVPRPLDPFPRETVLAPAWLANCRRAVAGEIAKARAYGSLLAWVREPEARRLFGNLQTEALTEHLPALQDAVREALARERYHAARGIPPAAAYVRHGPLTDLIERAMAHAGPLGFLSPLIRHVHPATLAGVAVGGAGVYLVKDKLRRRKEN